MVFGSLLCWNIYLRDIFYYAYRTASIPLYEKLPHIINFILQCFPFCLTCCSLYSAFGRCRTYRLDPVPPHKTILFFFLFAVCSPIFLLANQYALERNLNVQLLGTFRGLLEYKLFSIGRLRIVGR